MAEIAHSTTNVHRHPGLDARNLTLGSAARSWEASVCDLEDLANITSIVVAAVFVEPHNERYSISSGAVTQINFLVYDLQDRITQFKALYYEAIEAR